MTTSELLIDSTEVETALFYCLYEDDELEGKDGEFSALKDSVQVEGVTTKFGFHPQRLEEQREKVKTWLMALPVTFRKDNGGGGSFLQACMQENGVQWGEHMHIEQLFALGMGLGLVKCILPRPLWRILPGQMPYYVFTF
jgi:hypothetical protein